MSPLFDVAKKRTAAAGMTKDAAREYLATVESGRDLGWFANFASALRAEREAACSHPAEMRQPRLPSGTRCGACDETFS